MWIFQCNKKKKRVSVMMQILARANDDCYDAIAGAQITAIVRSCHCHTIKTLSGPLYYANSIWANSPPNYCYYAEMAEKKENSRRDS